MNHEIKSQDKINLDIRKFEPTDKAHSDVFNKPIEQLVNNDAFISGEIDKINKSVVDVDAINEASGSAIILTDTADGVFTEFKAYGRSEQKQYSGKNFIPYPYIESTHTDNGVTWTDNKDGTFTVSGTSTDISSLNISLRTGTTTPFVLQAGTYILTGCPSGGGTSNYRMNIGCSGDDDKWLQLATDYGNGDTFTLTKETKIGINAYVSKGVTVNNLTFKPMLRLSTIEDNTYEPYTGGVASPNPDYPQEIKNVADGGYFDGELLQGAYAGADGNWTLTGQYICNTNMMPCKANDKIKLEYAEIASQLMILFYDSNKNFISYVQSQSSSVLETTAVANACYFNFNISNPNGITPTTAKPISVTINGKYALIVKSKGKNLFVGLKGWYNISSNGVFTQSNGWLSTDYIACKPLENYTISLVENGSVGMWCFYNKNKDLLSSLASTNKQTITIPQDCYYFTQYTHGTNTDIQIEYGEKVTEYEPYKETVSYIQLNEPLRGIGNVSDERSLTEITRRFAEVVYDGSDDEGWAAHSVANWFLIKRPTGSINNLNTMCSHYTTNTSLNNVDYGFYIGGTYINFKNKDITSVDEWKALLQANPITVVYELAEPVVEAIEPVDITTYNNVTYLTASDNADMWVEYYSNSSVGKRLAKTNEEIKAEHIHLQQQITSNKAELKEQITAIENSLVPVIADSSTNIFKYGNVVMVHFCSINTTNDENLGWIVDTDVFDIYPPLHAGVYMDFMIMFTNTDTRRTCFARARVAYNGNRHFIELHTLEDGAMKYLEDGYVNGTIMYITK